MRMVKRALQLKAHDRRRFMRAYLQLIIVDIQLRMYGFKYVTRVAQTHGGCSPTRPVRANDVARARVDARWLRSAARHHIIEAHCLHRSLALHKWLRRQSLPSELKVGVRMNAGALLAHAWVELDGTVINDPPSVVSAYQPFTMVDGRQSVRAGGMRQAGVEAGSDQERSAEELGRQTNDGLDRWSP
jgi:hypothetical protein